jgi:hypothetical protein
MGSTICTSHTFLTVSTNCRLEITSMSVVLYLIKNHVDFSFGFLDLDNVYF